MIIIQYIWLKLYLYHTFKNPYIPGWSCIGIVNPCFNIKIEIAKSLFSNISITHIGACCTWIKSRICLFKFTSSAVILFIKYRNLSKFFWQSLNPTLLRSSNVFNACFHNVLIAAVIFIYLITQFLWIHLLYKS